MTPKSLNIVGVNLTINNILQLTLEMKKSPINTLEYQ